MEQSHDLTNRDQIRGLPGRTSEQLIAKSITIKGRGGKSGRCVAKKREARLGAQNTFEAVAREWFEKHVSGWTPSHSEKIMGRLNKDVFPWMGRRPISEITTPEVLEMSPAKLASGIWPAFTRSCSGRARPPAPSYDEWVPQSRTGWSVDEGAVAGGVTIASGAEQSR
jgi:hypothetical protein